MAATVSAAFVELIRRLLLTTDQAETASTRVAGLRDYMSADFTMAEKAFTIGSYRRGTLVRTERDVDLLAPLSYGTYVELYKRGSRAFLYFVRDGLNKRYSQTKVSSREVAVFLDFTVIRADVVPAFRRKGGGYVIPDGKNGWTSTNPPYHTRLVNDRDTALDHRLKPIIKLMKFWNIQNGGHLRSFHVELMAWRMWENASSLPAYSVVVAQTIDTMRSWLRSTFADPWPDGGHVDDYLGRETRAMVLRILDQDAKTSAEAEEYRKKDKIEKAFERWNSVFRKGFPAYG
jgi:hypothetical protein